jgi:hypothetical protein
MTLAGPFLVRPLYGAEERAGGWEDKRQALLAVGLGTLFAGVGLFVLSFFMGLSLVRAPLVPPLGFLFGLGLSLALVGLSPGHRAQRTIPILGRVAVATAGGALTQFLFDLASDKGLGITISWPYTFYRANASSLVEQWWPALTQQFPNWPYALGLADAALVGAALAAGITLGANAAARLLAFLNSAARWLTPQDQSAEV